MGDKPKSQPAMTVTLAHIAARCGVSNVTVSRALRGVASRVSPGKAEEIRTVARELGYEPGANHAARQLVMQKHGQQLLNHLLAIFLPMELFDAPYFLSLYRGVIEVVRREGFGLLTNYESVDGTEVNLLPLFARGEVDGALVFAQPQFFAPTLAQLRQSAGFGTRPMVSLIHPIPGCALVTADDRQGGYAAAAHLLALGHRRLLHFCGELTNAVFRQRYTGYRQACAEYGLEASAVLVAASWAYDDRETACALLRQALAAHPDTTAILAPNDQGAAWIHDMLTTQGRRVPEEISLIGYDDTDPLADADGVNRLTTVRVPLREIGAEAARLLIRGIHGLAIPELQVVLPSALVVRATTAPPGAPGG
jgi:DNA-binding LacI/PurR family transcriptional regulator